MNPQNYILYFTHGSHEYLNEAVFALLSYYAHHKEDENKVVIYTDNIDYFKEKLPSSIEYVQLNKETIKKWAGDINFVHRIKIELLKDFSTRFSGNALYLDTDTYFKQNISELFRHINNGSYVMSLNEGSMGERKNKIIRVFDDYLKRKNYQVVINGKEFVFSKNTKMYNAGAIGLNIPKDSEIFSDALALTDYIYPENPSHVVEQFAFCYLLQSKNPTIIEAEPLIHHYWYFKEFREIITRFFEQNKGKTFEELVKLSLLLNPERMGTEKLKYKNMNFLEKLIQKVTKFRKWKILE